MKHIARVSVVAVVLLSLVVPIHAALKASTVRNVPFQVVRGAFQTVPLSDGGATTLTFSGAGKHMITFASECQVQGEGTGSTLVLRIVLDPAGAAPPVALPPTDLADNGFCSSDNFQNVLATHSIAVATPILGSGTHSVSVTATVAGDAGDFALLDDISLIVTK